MQHSPPLQIHPILPDGSSFMIMEIGVRAPGLLNWLKYRPEGCARVWLFLWRMYWSCRALGGSRLEAIRWAWVVRPKIWAGNFALRQLPEEK